MMEDLGFSAQVAFPRRMTMNKRGCEDYMGAEWCVKLHGLKTACVDM